MKRVNKALKYLFDSNVLINATRKITIDNGLDPDTEASWILNDSIFVFYESVMIGVFNLTKASITTFIIAVAKRIAYTYKRSQNREVAKRIKLAEFDVNNPLNESSTYSSKESQFLVDRERAMKIALKALGERCEKILSLYAQRYKGEEMARLMGLTINSAKERLKVCKKKLHKYLTDPDNDEIYKTIRGK